jgi:hypothetical protein
VLANDPPGPVLFFWTDRSGRLFDVFFSHQINGFLPGISGSIIEMKSQKKNAESTGEKKRGKRSL